MRSLVSQLPPILIRLKNLKNVPVTIRYYLMRWSYRKFWVVKGNSSENVVWQRCLALNKETVALENLPQHARYNSRPTCQISVVGVRLTCLIAKAGRNGDRIHVDVLNNLMKWWGLKHDKFHRMKKAKLPHSIELWNCQLTDPCKLLTSLVSLELNFFLSFTESLFRLVILGRNAYLLGLSGKQNLSGWAKSSMMEECKSVLNYLSKSAFKQFKTPLPSFRN